MAIAGLIDGFRDWRSRKIADAGFRRLAARLALTRPVARRSAARLFDLTAGFVYSQILKAFLDTGACDFLSAGSRSVAEIAWHCRLPPDRAERLLKAASALDLAEPAHDGRYRLGALGAALIDNEGVRAMIAHHDLLYRDLADPVSMLRDGEPTRLSRFWDYSGESVDGAYSRLMAASQDFIAQEILDAWPFNRHRALLDVGGGDGTFLRAVHARVPGLHLCLFDLPPVAEIARERFRAAGVPADVTGGSFLADPIPRGADLVTLNRVLHDHDDDAARRLLKALHAGMRPGATLLVNEPMAQSGKARRAGDAYFGFYLLAMRQGEPRSAARITAMLGDAGFRDVRAVPTATPLLVSMIAACR